MIELKKRRSAKDERYECGTGKICSVWWAPIAAAGVGALGSIIGSRQGGGNERQQQQSQMVQWNPEQRQYLFGGDTWQPRMPMFNPYAVNYAGGLMAGYNPAFGPQQPMGMEGLLASLGGGGVGQGQQGGMPWFMDPNATPSSGGMAGLLGYGQGMPPPPLMNSPFFGHGVANPEILHDYPGSGLPQQGPAQPSPPPAQTGPRGPLPPYLGEPAAFQGSSLPWWAGEDARQARMTRLPSQVAHANRQRDADLRSLEGRNINDLTEEERAILFRRMR